MPSELARSIQTLFNLFDNDDEGVISFDKMKEGLFRLHQSDDSDVVLSVDDWEHITEHGRLCDEDGHMDAKQFDIMLQRQLCIYSLRRASATMKDCEPVQASALGLLKLILMIVESNKEEQEDLDLISAPRTEQPSHNNRQEFLFLPRLSLSFCSTLPPAYLPLSLPPFSFCAYVGSYL